MGRGPGSRDTGKRRKNASSGRGFKPKRKSKKDTGKGSEKHEGQGQMEHKGAGNQTDPSSNPNSMLDMEHEASSPTSSLHLGFLTLIWG